VRSYNSATPVHLPLELHGITSGGISELLEMGVHFSCGCDGAWLPAALEETAAGQLGAICTISAGCYEESKSAIQVSVVIDGSTGQRVVSDSNFTIQVVPGVIKASPFGDHRVIRITKDGSNQLRVDSRLQFINAGKSWDGCKTCKCRFEFRDSNMAVEAVEAIEVSFNSIDSRLVCTFVENELSGGGRPFLSVSTDGVTFADETQVTTFVTLGASDANVWPRYVISNSPDASM